MKKFTEFIKKNPWFPIVCVWIVLAAPCAIFLPSPINWICAGAVTLLAVVAFILLGINKYCLNVFKAMAPTSYFSDLRFRNMEAIAVGSTVAWKYLDTDTDKCYDSTGIIRSNAMCFNMLKTYFSHVRSGGKVFYVVDPYESDSIGEYISPCDFHHIHRLAFLYLGKSSSADRRAYPLVHDTSFSLRYVCTYFAKKHGLISRTWGRSASRIPTLSVDLCTQLNELRDFCEERELICSVIVINRSRKSDDELTAALRASLGWGEDALLTVVSNRKGLNSAVSC